MKILESQNAVLSNFEVYQHLLNEQYKFRDHERKKKVPRNAQTIVKEVLEYFKTPPSPLSQHPITYNGLTVHRLVDQLHNYELSKGEMIIILNVRPENLAVLSSCIEDFMTRFTEDQQNEMQAIIEQVLGPFPPKEHAEDGEAA
ncbi:RNA polymerase II [Coniella lustricola]|uniref:DNA-directed RNA polymerase III subunit RPC9 n=1 Tax=Coniella lustricola TaxID=2025994 RepID=A0A2T3A935_9PEZI|nr:RNA polymerase II [Coniella lustricola]